MTRTIAVTGARGFVAGHLLPRLAGLHGQVIAVVRPGREVAALARAGYDVRSTDLAAPDAAAFQGATDVVHLAGMALGPALVPVLEAAGVTRAVCVSSAGVYTRLPSPGASAKRAGESALARSRLRWTVLRPSMIYGAPGDRNLERLLRWLARAPWVPVPGGGGTPQQPVHVDDLVVAILAALERDDHEGRAYDVGGPESLSLRALIEASAAAVGRRAVIVSVPLRPTWMAARVARSVRLPFPVRPEQVLRLAESKAVDIGPAVAELGFRPRTFADGIRAEAASLGLARA